MEFFSRLKDGMKRWRMQKGGSLTCGVGVDRVKGCADRASLAVVIAPAPGPTPLLDD
jgi:hypothetical protein